MIRHTLSREAYNKWTEIDLSALQHNLNILRRASIQQQPRIMAVVKANAYGHNISLIAPALSASGIRDFGVATLAEAIYLQELLPQSSLNLILILGAQLPKQYPQIIAQGVDFILHTPEQLVTIDASAQALNTQARVHLKVDTGMGRVGIQPKQLPEVLSALKTFANIKLVGICSHLASSDEKNSEYLKCQLRCFKEVQHTFQAHPLSKDVQPIFHLANSDAVLYSPETHFDLVRPGIALYGYEGQANSGLKPVLSLKSTISQYKEVPAGSSIGYGCSFVTTCPSRLAVIAIGYADGVNRQLSNQQNVLIEGQLVPIVGRISMDQIVVDLSHTDIPGIPGTEITLIGQEGPNTITAADWARQLKTIPYEVLTGLGTRLPRYLKT